MIRELVETVRQYFVKPEPRTSASFLQQQRRQYETQYAANWDPKIIKRQFR